MNSLNFMLPGEDAGSIRYKIYYTHPAGQFQVSGITKLVGTCRERGKNMIRCGYDSERVTHTLREKL